MTFKEIQENIAAMYIAAYNRAPDQAGLEFWTEALENAEDSRDAYYELANGFVDQPVFHEIYDTENGNRKFVESLYPNIFGEPGDQEGIDFWTNALDNEGLTFGELLVNFVEGARNYVDNPDNPLNAEAIQHREIIENKIEVSLFYVETLGAATNMSGDFENLLDDPAYQQSIKVIENVTSDPATVTAAMDFVNDLANAEDPGVEGPGEEGQTYFLTEGADRDVTAKDGFLKGTDDNDTFIADVIQNSNGQQVNTLGTGDRLDGGKGFDTLEAQVTAGAYAGGFANMAIQARTKNIEEIVLEAVNSSAGSAFGTSGDEVFVNAKHMENVSYIGSERSNADLIIQDLTSKGVAGGVKNMTVGMKYTGNADTRWDESDLNVYFDQDYLTRESDTQNGWSYEILNQASWDINTNEPVKGFPLERITFTLDVGGVETRYTLDFTAEDRAAMSTQAGLVDMLNAKLAEQDVSGLEFQLGADFTDGDGRTSQSINLVNTDDTQEIVKGTVGLDEDSPSGNLYWDNKILEDVVTLSPTSVNVELEKVGRAGDGGELVIGSMNKTSANEWGAVNTVGENTVSGIEEFNVTVDGGKAESSSLAGLHSTNNNLRTVNVVSAEGSKANLTIGNSNTGGLGTLSGNANALKDVRTFDASKFKGDLTLHAALTDEVTQKYMDLRDQQANPAGDNFEFAYTGGDANDTIDLVLSSANLAAAGTTTREDFSLTVDGGKGDDTLIVSIQDGGLAGTAGNWYANSKINANLNVNGGDGDDTVYINGGGDWVVKLGAGNDVVYAGNSGNVDDYHYPASAADQGTIWVLNTQDQAAAAATGVRQLDDLQSSVINEYASIYKSTIAVSFKQADGTYTSKKVEVPTDDKYKVTDLHINQAIKEAINTDSVLSNLLVAEDGPGGTLVVSTLIDGLRTAAADLTIDWKAPAAGTLNASDVASYNAAHPKATVANAAALEALSLANVNTAKATSFTTDYTAAYAASTVVEYDPSTGGVILVNAEYKGSDSAFASDNIITGGAGNDVIVLGTNKDSNDTVKYEGFGNGKDTIVNFTAGAGAGDFKAKNDPYTTSTTLLNNDFLDLTSYKAKYVDFGVYTTTGGVTTWGTGGANADFGKGTATSSNLAVNDTFLRVNEAKGVYEVEVWKVKVASTDVTAMTDGNIELLGTVGTLDFGLAPVAGFFDANNFMI